MIAIRGQQWDEREKKARCRMAGEKEEGAGDTDQHGAMQEVNVNTLEETPVDKYMSELDSVQIKETIEPNIQSELDDLSAVNISGGSHQRSSYQKRTEYDNQRTELESNENYGTSNLQGMHSSNKTDKLNGNKNCKDTYEEKYPGGVLPAENANLAALKAKLANTSLGFTANIAAMAAAQSHSLGLVSDTFGDDESDSGSEGVIEG